MKSIRGKQEKPFIALLGLIVIICFIFMHSAWQSRAFVGQWERIDTHGPSPVGVNWSDSNGNIIVFNDDGTSSWHSLNRRGPQGYTTFDMNWIVFGNWLRVTDPYFPGHAAVYRFDFFEDRLAISHTQQPRVVTIYQRIE